MAVPLDAIRSIHNAFRKDIMTIDAAAHSADLIVTVHACGNITEILPDLIEIGVQVIHPLQPEVMDVDALVKQYRGRLAFHGGLSTQRTLPFGSQQDVRDETRRLLEKGRQGNYIFSPAHAVEGDVPLENMLAFIDVVQHQDG